MIQSLTNRGSAPIFISLFFALLLTSSAIALSGTLTRQLRASQDIEATERAFSAANAGAEAVLTQLRQEGGEDIIEVTGTIPYEDGSAADYVARGRLVLTPDQVRAVPCVNSRGVYRDSERRIELGRSQECDE